MKALFVGIGLVLAGVGIWYVKVDLDRLLSMTLKDPADAFILDAVILIAGTLTIVRAMRSQA